MADGALLWFHTDASIKEAQYRDASRILVDVSSLSGLGKSAGLLDFLTTLSTAAQPGSKASSGQGSDHCRTLVVSPSKACGISLQNDDTMQPPLRYSVLRWYI